jgi:hypothetical protein
MATRRLPVIQEPTGEDAEAAARPPWQWVLIGSGLLVTIWTPSVAVCLAIARWLAAGSAGAGPPLGAGLAAILVAVTFALSSVAAGYLVGRFGRRTQPRHVAFAGLAAAGEIWVLALLGGAFPTALVGGSALTSLCLLAAGFSALGGWISRRARAPKPPTGPKTL